LPGEIVHIEIPADDTKRSQEFWGSLFGWQFQANPGPFEYHTTQIGGEQGAAARM
jgi:predicted enzyme related to lactoylglutathione lyase